MAFELKQKETAPEGIRRLLRERIASALDRLKQSHGNPEESVHEARKDLKKVRAVLRLLRPHLGNARFRKENHRYRDVGRVLSQVRDAHVLEETLEKLKKAYPGKLPAAGVKAAQARLGELIAQSETAIFGDKEVLSALSASLKRGKEALGGLDLDALTWKGLEKGLRRVFKDGRRALAQAFEKKESALFHEWRKQVKYLRYHVEILEPAWPEPLGTLAKELHELSDRLGEEHDLFVLDEFLGEGNELHEWITRRQEELRERNSVEGKRIYAERARAFAKRIFSYVETWRALNGKAAPVPKHRSPTAG